MREEVKTRISGAGAALATSVTLAAFQGGRLGGGIFGKQVTATLVVLSWMPYMHRTSAHTALPRAIFIPLSLFWVCACFAPTFAALVLDLFTGHRFEGSQWYNSLWRVYAIMGLWMAIAVINERIVRPWWRKNSDKILGPVRSNSVSAQSRQIAEDKRAEALEAIKAKMVAVFKKKKLAERSIEAKKKEITLADDSIKKAEKMLEKATERVDAAAPNEKNSAKDDIDVMAAMVENSRLRKACLFQDIERAKLDIQETEPQIEALRQEWTEALHIENYTQFYR